MSFAQWFGAVKGEKLSAAAPESNPSLPGGRRVRGYTISRLPFGAYLQALEKLQSLPGDLLKACFPGKAADEILTAQTIPSRPRPIPGARTRSRRSLPWVSVRSRRTALTA